jgi:mannose-6-phosphate isomerase-like protein (cupin superfamily)
MALVIAGTICWIGSVGADGAGNMLPEVRRIITVTGETGEPVVLADGASANAIELNGSRITRIWETQEMPVPLDVTADVGATAGNAYRDGFIGSSFYIADIPPGSDLSDIPLHAQDSLDYIAVLEGEIDLVLPGESIKMNRGDILVQAGNVHSWANLGDTPCRLLVVVLTGRR